MELRHLRSFVAVAEERHFGRAAERLHMAQPPLSQQIRRLEAELGVTLLHRTTRSVELAPAGEVLLARAREILAAVDGAAEDARRAARGEFGRLAVGFTGSATYALLPAVAAALREALLVVLPEAHPLAEADSVPLEELEDEPFIVYPSHFRSVVHDAVEETCAAHGFLPRVALEVSETATLVSFVAAGLGVSLVPESVRHMTVHGAVYRPLARDATAVELAVAWRRADTSPVLERALQVVRRELGARRVADDPPSPGEGSRRRARAAAARRSRSAGT